jgi:hypothetical protein
MMQTKLNTHVARYAESCCRWGLMDADVDSEVDDVPEYSYQNKLHAHSAQHTKKKVRRDPVGLVIR